MCPEIGLLKLSASKYVSNIVLPSPWTKLMWSGRQRNKSTGEKLTKVSTRLRTSLYMINCSFSFVHCLKNKQEQQNTTSDGRKRRLSATAFSVRKLNVTIKKEYLSDCLHFQTRQQFPVPTICHVSANFVLDLLLSKAQRSVSHSAPIQSQWDLDTELPFAFEKLNSSYISILLSHFHLTSAGTDKNIWMILSILIHFSILNKLARLLLFIRWLECKHMNCFEIWGKTVKFYAQDFLNKSSLPRYCFYWTGIVLTTCFNERRAQTIESTYKNTDLYLKICH